MNFLSKLIILANKFDQKNLYLEADQLDKIIAQITRTIPTWEEIYEYVMSSAPQYGIKHMDKQLGKTYAIQLHTYLLEATNTDPKFDIYTELTTRVRDFFTQMRAGLEQDWIEYIRSKSISRITESVSKRIKITPKVQQYISVEADKMAENQTLINVDTDANVRVKLWIQLITKATNYIIGQTRAK